ncbi:hypothetical protein APSETT445_007131 [Aspergillus pseudonomiae]
MHSRVLLVGAGGIGCELLKNLLLSGFGEIHIIDLDTIDLSNLNRQFLFRFEHIKKSKALVAKEVAQKFQPSAKLEAYHANIKDSRFNVDWFANFDVVFNALDNLDARRHVNRMCLAADVPLIESGTTGFNGQVQVIKKKLSRSSELFGTSEDETPELDSTEDASNAEEIANLRKEAQALKEIRESMGSPEFAHKVFTKVFKEDIDRLRGMEDMWKTRKAPEPLDFEKIQGDASSIEPTISSNDQKVWTLAEDLVVFKDRFDLFLVPPVVILLTDMYHSLDRLSKRLKTLLDTTKDDVKPILVFDKDDVDTLDFVTASANLRATIFGIEPKSKFDTKPIATTNAMTAGLCVLQAFKVLKDDYAHAKMIFLERSGARAINSDSLKPPNPNCPVCSVAQARVKINPEQATINDLVQDILRSQLGYGEELSVSNELGTIYDPDLEDNLTKKLSELGVSNESLITIIDEEDEQPRVNLELVVMTEKPESSAPEQKPITLVKVPEIPRKPQAPTPTVSEHVNGTSDPNKRKRNAEEAGLTNGEDRSKRVASISVADGDGSNPIVLDETEGGAILIDD